jgi:CDP-paratose 2-epimerase
MSIDATTHSLFGASKLAADVLVQEYGRYFGLNTACFRAGCITGPNHAGAELHGFLSYLMRCVVTGTPYTIHGYKGKQVRDNIHSRDLVNAFHHWAQDPRPGEVFNVGGGRFSHCSMREAIALCEEIAGRKLDWRYEEAARVGDHIWWVSGLGRLRGRFPDWKPAYGIRDILAEIFERNREQWS